jgi:hypothetical protein
MVFQAVNAEGRARAAGGRGDLVDDMAVLDQVIRRAIDPERAQGRIVRVAEVSP